VVREREEDVQVQEEADGAAADGPSKCPKEGDEREALEPIFLARRLYGDARWGSTEGGDGVAVGWVAVCAHDLASFWWVVARLGAKGGGPASVDEAVLHDALLASLVAHVPRREASGKGDSLRYQLTNLILGEGLLV